MSVSARANEALWRRLRSLQRRARALADSLDDSRDTHPSPLSGEERRRIARRADRLARDLGAFIEEAQEAGGLTVERVGL